MMACFMVEMISLSSRVGFQHPSFGMMAEQGSDDINADFN